MIIEFDEKLNVAEEDGILNNQIGFKVRTIVLSAQQGSRIHQKSHGAERKTQTKISSPMCL